MAGMDDKLGAFGIVPVAVIDDSKDAVSLAQALIEGGLPCVEVTFRTSAAAASIKLISDAFPEMLVGAGTVLSVEQAHSALEAGARFIVAPGFDEELVDYCLEQGVPVYPGCATASEITQAYKRGLRVVKFFPCGQLGGLATIKALAAPFVGMRFMPTGGINVDNVGTYLASDKVLACGGSWMLPAQLVREGKFDRITELVREAVSLVSAARA